MLYLYYIYDYFEDIDKYEINIKNVCVSTGHTNIRIYKVYVRKYADDKIAIIAPDMITEKNMLMIPYVK